MAYWGAAARGCWAVLVASRRRRSPRWWAATEKRSDSSSIAAVARDRGGATRLLPSAAAAATGLPGRARRGIAGALALQPARLRICDQPADAGPRRGGM